MKNSKIIEVTEKVEQVVISVLLFSLLIVVAYSTVVFISLLFGGLFGNIQDSFSEQSFLTRRHDIFEGFLLILVGIGLIHMVKSYLIKNIYSVKIVIVVTLVGISRHMIDLDYKKLDPYTIVGLSSVIIALAISYYFVKKGLSLK